MSVSNSLIRYNNLDRGILFESSDKYFRTKKTTERSFDVSMVITTSYMSFKQLVCICHKNDHLIDFDDWW